MEAKSGWRERARRSRLLRGAVESPAVQVTFHAAGGVGLGLVLAALLPRRPAVGAGLLLQAAALLGHWYAVWSDPGGAPR